jgi:hypothetical protein
MSVPSHAVQVDGQGPVTADQLNSFIQTCSNVSDARGFIGVSGMLMYLNGYISAGDGGQGMFFWNAGGSAADDGGLTTIVPTGAASGIWSRIGTVAAAHASSSTAYQPSVGTTSTVGVMQGLAGSITPTRSGIVVVGVQGDVENNTASDGGSIGLRTGIGSIPAIGTPLAGTLFGTVTALNNASTANVRFPFYVSAIFTMTLGVPNWIDVSLAAATGGTTRLNDLNYTAHEL